MTYWIHKHGVLRAVSTLLGITKQNDTETTLATVIRYKDSYTVLAFLDRRWSLDNSTCKKLLNFPTPYSKVLQENLVKKFTAFYESAGSLPRINEPATCPHSETDQFSACSHPNIWRSILILPHSLRLGLPCGLFPSGFRTKTLTCILTRQIRTTRD